MEKNTNIVYFIHCISFTYHTSLHPDKLQSYPGMSTLVNLYRLASRRTMWITKKNKNNKITMIEFLSSLISTSVAAVALRSTLDWAYKNLNKKLQVARVAAVAFAAIITIIVLLLLLLLLLYYYYYY